MEIIKEIFEKELNSIQLGKYKDRYSTKVILLNNENKVALVHYLHSDLYMLPGGKLDNNETPEEAAKREAKEETGYEIEIIKELGLIIDYKDKINQKNYNYCFVAKIIGQAEERNLTENEMKNGIPQLEWLNLDEAIESQEKEIKSSEEQKYISNYIQEVQKYLLTMYKEQL